MERFRGQPLGPRPRIAVFSSDKIGNFVVGSVVLRALRERYPDGTIVYVTDGERSRDFARASRLIDDHVVLRLGERPEGRLDLGISGDGDAIFQEALAALEPRYVAGPARGLPELPDRIGDLWAEPGWNRADLLQDFGDFLRSQYLGEIWCRLASLETDFTRTEIPTADPGASVPDVLIATGGTRSTKNWPVEYWHGLVRLLARDGLSVGLVGIARSLQAAHYGPAVHDDRLIEKAGVVDLRGRWTLPQVAGAAQRARAVVTIDNAIGHIGAAVGAPTVMIWGGSPWRLWAPRTPNARHVLPAEVCGLCEAARFKNLDCVRERQVCTSSVSPHRVASDLRSLVGSS